jgi:hypothetical protein
MKQVQPRTTRNAWIWFLAIVFILACGVPSSQPEPTAHPVIPLETVIAQTAHAAQTQTATAAPSATKTPTFLASLTPSRTPTPETPTPTFFFVFFTETPLIIPTDTQQLVVSAPGTGRTAVPTEGSNAEKFKTPVPWACTVVSKFPGNGYVVDPKASFTVSWTVLNKGTKTWTANTIDFVYSSGYRTEGRKIQDLSGSVAPGQQVTLKLSVVAPKQGGDYNLIWTLQVGNDDFCHMKTTFEVRKK